MESKKLLAILRDMQNDWKQSYDNVEQNGMFGVKIKTQNGFCWWLKDSGLKNYEVKVILQTLCFVAETKEEMDELWYPIIGYRMTRKEIQNILILRLKNLQRAINQVEAQVVIDNYKENKIETHLESLTTTNKTVMLLVFAFTIYCLYEAFTNLPQG